MTPDHDALAEARARLEEGDPAESFATMRRLLRFSAGTPTRDEFVERFSLFARLARAITGDAFGARIEAAAARPDDAQTLFNAAYAAYEEGLHDVAATMLLRADALAPGQVAIVAELSSNLERCMAYGFAARAIERSGLAARSPLCAALLGFHLLMTGDRDGARAHLPPRREGFDAATASARASLAAMIARADAIHEALPLDGDALTGLHGAINASVLLHESPLGADAGMNGRYAYATDSAGLMHEGLERLSALLAVEGIEVARVVAAPDRASRVLALAAGAMLSLPVAVWTPGERPEGLFVCWDLDKVGDAAFLGALRHHAPGQVLFAHASRWVDPFPYAPDVTTLLHQSCQHPYTGGALRVDPVSFAVVRAAPDARDEAALAAEIVAARPGDPSRRSHDAPLAVARATRALAEADQLGLRRASGARARQRVGGPVMSNRFA